MSHFATLILLFHVSTAFLINSAEPSKAAAPEPREVEQKSVSGLSGSATASIHRKYLAIFEGVRSDLTQALACSKIHRCLTHHFPEQAMHEFCSKQEYAPITTAQELIDGGYATHSFRCKLPSDVSGPITIEAFKRPGCGFTGSSWENGPSCLRHTSRKVGGRFRYITTRKSAVVGHRVYAMLASQHYYATRRVPLNGHPNRPLGVVIFKADHFKTNGKPGHTRLYEILDTPEHAYIPLGLNEGLDACPTWEARSNTFGLMNYATKVFSLKGWSKPGLKIGIPPCSLTEHSPLYILQPDKRIWVINARLGDHTTYTFAPVTTNRPLASDDVTGCGLHIRDGLLLDLLLTDIREIMAFPLPAPEPLPHNAALDHEPEEPSNNDDQA